MTCRNIKTLINRVRSDSNFTSTVSAFSTTVGVQDSYIIDLFNDAKDEFVAAACDHDETVFQAEVQTSLSSLGGSYTPARLSCDIKVVSVKYRKTSTSSWVAVPQRSISNIVDPVQATSPLSYWLTNGTINFEGDATEGDVWIVWEQLPDYLAYPIGAAGSFVGSTTSLTSFTTTYGVDGFGTSYTDAALNNAFDKCLCIVDRNGNPIIRNIEYSSVSSGAVTALGSGHTYAAGEYDALTAAVAAGATLYVVPGQNVTTHSPLPREAETFFVYYATEHVCGTKGASFEKQTFLRRRKERALELLVSRYESGTKDIDEIEEVDDELMLRGSVY